jgi:hypothetical protein
MVDAMRSLVSGRGLAALGRGGGALPMLAASVQARQRAHPAARDRGITI